ncbi:hypothetical protein [Nonomuraea ceibae]|uniref:hypothetical protein n=1 Tax=Nonomuraea ceibae TaxID=1935170 RepID=UPI001C5D8616|nr:hypothetical protein [Nonomuraea ceibae]
MRLCWRKPYLVVDVRANLDKGEHHPYEPFLEWMRSEGLNPEDGTRCEVYRGLVGPYAVGPCSGGTATAAWWWT